MLDLNSLACQISVCGQMGLPKVMLSLNPHVTISAAKNLRGRLSVKYSSGSCVPAVTVLLLGVNSE